MDPFPPNFIQFEKKQTNSSDIHHSCCKLVLHKLQENSPILIQHAQEEFFTHFGYDTSLLPIPLSNIMNIDSLQQINQAMITRTNISQQFHLFAHDQTSNVYEVSLLNLTGGNANIPSSSERWAVVTISF